MPAVAKLVTLTQAKAQLHITTPPGDPGDQAIQDTLDAAEEIILKYLKGANGLAVDWVDPTTAPGNVTQAIKLVVGQLDIHRGDDKEDWDVFWGRIQILLVGYRDPALA